MSEILDREELFALVRTERISRDVGRWETLRECYWPDARIRVTWFDGPRDRFIERSQEQSAAGRGQGIHFCLPVSAQVDGSRGLVESRGTIQVRARLHGIEVDIDHWCRFLCRAERDGDRWRLRQFDAIYGRDRVQAVRPDERLEIDWSLAEPLRPAYRWLAYLNVANGYDYDDSLPGDDRRDLVAAFEAESLRWLAGETPPATAGRPGSA
jgi:hypothetical protein